MIKAYRIDLSELNSMRTELIIARRVEFELIIASSFRSASFLMFSYFSVNCVFNIIEYFSYLNLWLVILFLFIMAFFFVLGSTQLINSSRLCSDVVFETSLVLFSLFLIAIIISPALIILLDLELIIMPSFIIYSCGVQWLWSFSLSYLNWISNCDHYVYSSYLVSNGLIMAERNGLNSLIEFVTLWSIRSALNSLFRTERNVTSWTKRIELAALWSIRLVQNKELNSIRTERNSMLTPNTWTIRQIKSSCIVIWEFDSTYFLVFLVMIILYLFVMDECVRMELRYFDNHLFEFLGLANWCWWIRFYWIRIKFITSLLNFLIVYFPSIGIVFILHASIILLCEFKRMPLLLQIEFMKVWMHARLIIVFLWIGFL